MIDELLEEVKKAREQGKKIGLVQGSWDLFHIGHLRYMKKAKELCDYLIVGMDSDEKIRLRKGPSRPIIPEKERYDFIKQLDIADYIVIKPANEPKWNLIKEIKPDVLIAIKDNYSDEDIIKLKDYCGNVAILPRQSTTSTSDKIRKIIIKNNEQKITNIKTDVTKSIDELKKRINYQEDMPTPIPELIANLHNSTDGVCPVSAACLWNNKWYFGSNQIDLNISNYDIENRTELFYNLVEHAEMNLLKNMGTVKELNTPIYTTLFPCDKCMKVLIAKGVKEIYYLEDHPEKNWSKRSHELANKNNIKTTQMFTKTIKQEEIINEINMNNFKYIYPPNAREQEQLDIMMNMENNDHDPLDMKYINQEILYTTNYWFITANKFPYEDVDKQILIVSKDPIYRKEDITNAMWLELKEILNQISDKYNIPGGALCYRFGDPALSGASLKRVHLHIIVPKEEKKVKFNIGGKRTLKKGLIIK